jgi:hypothetical protein
MIIHTWLNILPLPIHEVSGEKNNGGFSTGAY